MHLHLLFFITIFVMIDALSPAANIIMSSIGFFGPLLRIFKSIYSMDNNSSSKTDYGNIRHAAYEHLQHASDKEVESSIECNRKRKIKKVLLSPEELKEAFSNVNEKNGTFKNSGMSKTLSHMHKSENIFSANSTLHIKRLNSETAIDRALNISSGVD